MSERNEHVAGERRVAGTVRTPRAVARSRRAPSLDLAVRHCYRSRGRRLLVVPLPPSLASTVSETPSQADAPVPHAHIRLDVEPGRRLALDRYGDPQAPPIVFLHGGGQTRHAWGKAARLVARRGWCAYTLDHRGHGDSDWHPDAAYHFDDFTDDLEKVIDAVSTVAPPVLVGASLGGIVSIIAETREAARTVCRAIVLVDVTPRLQVAGVARILTFMQAHPDGFASLEEAADHVAAFLPNRPRPKDLSGLEKNLRRGDDGRWRWHWDPRMMGDANAAPPDPEKVQRSVEEHLERAAELDVPVLLVRGRMSDVVSEDDARQFLAAVPHAEYVDVADAAHMVAGDRNDVFIDAVVAFLDRHFG